MLDLILGTLTSLPSLGSEPKVLAGLLVDGQVGCGSLLGGSLLEGSLLEGSLLEGSLLGGPLLAWAPPLQQVGQWLQALNWVDCVLLLGLASGLFVGIGVGFYRQVAIFLSLGIGLFAASRLTDPILASERFQPVQEVLGPEWAQVAAFAAVLWAALVVGLLCCLVFHSFFSRTLRVADGALGGAMGVVISAVFFGLVLLGVFHHGNSRQFEEPIRTSKIGVQLAEGTRVVSRLLRLPSDIQERFDRAIESPPGGPSAAPPEVDSDR